MHPFIPKKAENLLVAAAFSQQGYRVVNYNGLATSSQVFSAAYINSEIILQGVSRCWICTDEEPVLWSDKSGQNLPKREDRFG